MATPRMRPFLLCAALAAAALAFSCGAVSGFVPVQTRSSHGSQQQKQFPPESSLKGAEYDDVELRLKTWMDAVATPDGASTAAAHWIPATAQDVARHAATWLSAHPLALAGLAGSVATLLAGLAVAGGDPAAPTPYPRDRYDAAAATRYFRTRLPAVVRRAAEILVTSLGFGVSVWADALRGRAEENAERRALELARLLTQLGPTFIKVGQTLSIRTDLLSPAYIRGLQSLQDRVPAFNTDIAKGILEEEWGVASVDSVVDLESDEPVAAASLGQVYKARRKDTGQAIAIKVQRPDIEEQIALDMYLLRLAGKFLKQFADLNSDAVGTVDAWGAGFVDELDYRAEARNAESFVEGIAATPLRDVVFSPRVLGDLSTRRVLVTEWVDGERLDRSSNEDVTILCSIAMNTYLTMMLELGTLHCDPHPGNLLRTPEGRLCILDWGMVTRLDENLQISLIEHMAHLTSKDYEEIPRDLLVLGFIPESKADMIEDSGVVETLTDVYSAFISGGRAAAPVSEVVSQLSAISATKGNIFQIPPYFAYIAKSFSVLEGIGLSIDSSYSIIAECLPYTSKRLLTDKNERTGLALSSFIFGSDKSDLKNRVIKYSRVEQLVTGFGEYTTSATGELVGEPNKHVTRAETLERYADQVFDLVFAEEETPLQAILLEQLAKIFSSGSRAVVSRFMVGLSCHTCLPDLRSMFYIAGAIDGFGVVVCWLHIGGAEAKLVDFPLRHSYS